MIETKQIMLEELNQKISTWNDYSETMYGYSKTDAQSFLKRFQVGVYDAILKETFWFQPQLSIDTLINWEKDRKLSSVFTNITEENYIVYSTLLEIKEHINKLSTWKQIYNTNYHTKINNFPQPPLSNQTLKQFNSLYKKILNRNSNWRQAREIIDNFQKINITENKDFSTNLITILEKLYNPQPTIYYPNYFQKNIQLLDIISLDIKIKELLKSPAQEIQHYLTTTPKTYPNNYIIQSIRNLDSSNIDNIKKLLNSLIVPKKINNLSTYLDSLSPKDITSIQKHYNFIYKNTTELEYVEETSKILDKLLKTLPNTEENIQSLVIIFNVILISKKIVPPILTKEMLTLDYEERTNSLLQATINPNKN